MTASPLLAARRVTDDPSLSEWERKAKQTKRNFSTVAWTVGMHVAILLPATLLTIFPFPPNLRGFLWAMTAFVSLAMLRFNVGAENEDFYLQRAARKNIRKARRTAKRASNHSESPVTVLTKDHVEARSRVEEVVTRVTEYDGYSVVIHRVEREAIYALLFENLSREKLIISLIEDRKMLTAQEIKEALDDMETRPTALWDGTL